MTEEIKTKSIKLIDRLIPVFLFLFIISLTNSIFVNQLGYYLAILLLIFRAFLNKKNEFSKNGLEYFILFLLFAEILSTVLSAELYNSFYNVLKRFLLIPIIYFIPAAVKDYKTARWTIQLFLAAGIITGLIYLIYSYDYFVYNLYSSEDSGPNLFEHSITTGELFTFPLLVLLSFLFNEKTDYKKKLIFGFGIFIMALALLATYKRTGWLGAAAGIVMILILTRKYLVMIFLGILLTLFLLLQNTASYLDIYELNSNKLIPVKKEHVEGRAGGMVQSEGEIFITAYEEGILKYRDGGTNSYYKTDSPADNITRFNDSLFIAGLVDSRFIIINKKNEKVGELISPGISRSLSVLDEKIYVLDRDSGITVFNMFPEIKIKARYPQFSGYDKMKADSPYIVLYSRDSLQIVILKINESGIPEEYKRLIVTENPFMFSPEKNRLILSEEKNLTIREIEKFDNVKTIPDLKRITSILKSGGKYFGINTNKELIEFKIDDSLNIYIVQKYLLPYIPNDLIVNNNRVYLTFNKTNKLLSVVDPYKLSNLTRIWTWTAGIKIFKDYWLTGIGDIDTKEYHRKYRQSFEKEYFGHMHNNFIHILVTLGVIGFIAVMLFFAKILIILLKNIKTTKNIPYSGSFNIGAVACFVSFLVSGLTEWNFGDHEVISILWFTTGLSIALYQISRKEEKKSEEKM